MQVYVVDSMLSPESVPYSVRVNVRMLKVAGQVFENLTVEIPGKNLSSVTRCGNGRFISVELPSIMQTAYGPVSDSEVERALERVDAHVRACIHAHEQKN